MGKRRVKKPKTDEALFLPQDHGTKAPSMIEKTCISKSVYYSLKEAQDAALMVRVGGEKNVYAYSCNWCDNFHIGHSYN